MSGTGKSFYSKYLVNKFKELNKRTKVLDGDDIRNNYDAPLGFSKEDINKNNLFIASKEGSWVSPKLSFQFPVS